MEPSQVNVSGTLDSGTISRTIDVKTILSGNLPDGVLLRKVFTEPVKVEIKGPKDIIDKINVVNTEPGSLTGITKDVTKEVTLQLPSTVTINRKTVMVRITVGQGP